MSGLSEYIPALGVVLASHYAISADHFSSSGVSSLTSSTVSSGSGTQISELVNCPSGVGIVFLLYPT